MQAISDLTQAMFRLAQDPTLRLSMGEAARKRVAEYFAWDNKGEWIDHIYQEIANRCS
jgi:glycosyltransferase involved in cell wall biosynthesis